MGVVDDDVWAWPLGPQLGWHNRRVIADRIGWPEGALEACEAIERVNPDWSPWWQAANTIPGWEAPAGFYARPNDSSPYAYGETADSLAKVIEARTSRCQACGTWVPVPVGSETPLHRADADGDWCCARWHQITIDAGWSHCPRCMTWFDLQAGRDVPPHQATDGTGWCPVRCSQKTA